MKIVSNLLSICTVLSRPLFYFYFQLFDRKWQGLQREERYQYLQKSLYEKLNLFSNYEKNKKRDLVVGSYEKQNEWTDYDEYLMKYVEAEHKNKMALDFGCGPGRNIIKYHSLFKRIDGVDISSRTIDHAKKQVLLHNIESSFYVSSGNDLGDSQPDYYDFIFSSIVMQHICVWKIRCDIFKSMYHALKEDGRISIQMGYGEKKPGSVEYYANNYSATLTNGSCDTRVENPEQLEGDLREIGFKRFEFWIRPVGPGDFHSNWIFFTAIK